MFTEHASRTTSSALALTSAAMLAFAGNSVLCRLALGQGLMDAASFTTVRVLAGAALLGILSAARSRPASPVRFDLRTVIALSAYMVSFSFAYRSLGAGTGALLLFGAVQLTMFAAALRAGERLSPAGWFGVALAVAGLGYLVAPGITAPEPVGALLMTAAGVAWGVYSLLGRGSTDPLQATARNFAGSVPVVGLVSLVYVSSRGFHCTARGLLLAIASGAVTSGLGYVVWYAALRHLSAARAATVQLSVPVIAAIGGVALLAEPLTWRLALASLVTLGGIAIVLGKKRGAAGAR